MAEYWKANKDIHGKLMELVGKNHPDLSLIADEIFVFFKDKATKAAPIGKATKASPLHVAMFQEPIKFFIEIPADLWEHELTSKQREALLDYHLCSCRAEEDPKSGDIKLSVAKPEIQVHPENFERYGLWQPRSEESEDAEKGPEDELVEALLAD